MKSFIDNLTFSISNYLPKGKEHFSDIKSWVMFCNGLTDFEETMIFFGIKNNNSYPSLVAKVPRMLNSVWDAKAEYNHLIEYWNCLADNAYLHFPEPIALLSINGHPAMITSFVEGESLVYNRIINDPKSFSIFSIAVAKLLHKLINYTISPLVEGEVVISDFDNKATKFKTMYILSPSELLVLEDLLIEVQSSAKSATHKILVHGDFWHGNIIRNKRFDSLMLIDFQYSHWSNNASLDVYLFLLAGALNNVNDLDPAKRAQKASELLFSWKSNIIPSYLSVFELHETYTLFSLRSGLLFCCIEKAVRASIELGYERDLDLVWRYMFYEISQWKE